MSKLYVAQRESHSQVGTGFLGDSGEFRTEKNEEICTLADFSDISLV